MSVVLGPERQDAGVSKPLTGYWLAVISAAGNADLDAGARAEVIDAACATLRTILHAVMSSQAQMYVLAQVLCRAFFAL